MNKGNSLWGNTVVSEPQSQSSLGEEFSLQNLNTKSKMLSFLLLRLFLSRTVFAF